MDTTNYKVINIDPDRPLPEDCEVTFASKPASFCKEPPRERNPTGYKLSKQQSHAQSAMRKKAKRQKRGR